MPEAGLTWHAGSVLPYASLWHTVLRACALNALHPRDLPSTQTPSPRAVHLLDNHAGNLDVHAFADQLGESPAAFRWATLDQLPSPLRAALVQARPRLCLACLTAGYHCALFSVDLLRTCPLHGSPLVDRCYCGAPFHTTLRSIADFGTAGACRCGRLHFFTRETCRRPTLAPEMTHAFDPVAAWLEALSTLIRPGRLDDALLRRDPDSVRWLVTTARTLGVTYPPCLRPVAPSAPVVLVQFGTRPGSVSNPAPPRPEDERSSYWRASPTTTVYRAFARHVRRHLAPGGNRWVARFIDSGDPLLVGEQVRACDRARRAFADMVWAHTIEVEVERRRWPDRPPPYGEVACFTAHVAAGSHVLGGQGLTAPARAWLEGHGARVNLATIWQAAEARATAAACSGIAAWDTITEDTTGYQRVWLARLRPDGLHFAAPATTHRTPMPGSDKAARRIQYAVRRQARLEAMWTACRGACLSWSEDAGWYVIDAIAPADDDVRRRRLLGLKEGRPWCWLYRAGDGRFVARWDQARLQVLDGTPAAAIASLRRYARDYRRVCQVDLPVSRPIPLIEPEQMDPRLTADYRYFVALIRCRKGFWRDAGVLADAARYYQHTQASRGWPSGDSPWVEWGRQRGGWNRISR
ncbi:hypothetical protein [Burkholderia glumae]|uniref:Transposon Tn7 transposition protein TnsD C-termianl domain-containing protein n=1 Tax=Burkholderia glumae TaxID=337 RepID=A0ABY5BBE6_BURGL|nr:hypothetical protein [Burkholderia glumae]USS44328.1 hypothetical protein NFI99_13065 [Burkholderia glumae]